MNDIFTDALHNRIDKIYEYLRIGSINIKDDNGMTLLHYACLGAANEVAIHLIEQGINVNAIDFSGQTAIFIAVRNKLFGITKALVENHANLGIVNNRGESLISIAVLNGTKQIVEYLLDNYNFDLTISNINLENVLFYAIKGRKFDLFKRFVEADKDLIYAKDYHNTNLLQAAIKYNDIDAFNYLKDKISIYQLDNLDNNAVMYVARYANSAIAIEFFKLHPIIEAKNKEQLTIEDIQYENTYDITHIIEMYKNSYDYISYLRTYPLHVAVIKKDYNVLMAYHYDKNKKDIYNTSILDLAKTVGDANILKILQNKDE